MWITYAVLAAVFWGLDYAFAEKVIEKISIVTFMAAQLLLAGFSILVIALFSSLVQEDLAALSESRELLAYFLLGAIAFTIGNFMILQSIHSKNATLAGMIEISYPLFIALFAYLLFKENQISVATMMGGLLIFSGVFII